MGASKLYNIKLENLLLLLLRIIKSYLNERSFFVRVGKTYSKLCFTHGVPQGSVLCPVLYAFFSGDLKGCDKITMCTYSDDTIFVAIVNCLQEVGAILQDQLNKTYKWTEKWRIKVRAEKSAHLTFASSKVNQRC